MLDGKELLAALELSRQTIQDQVQVAQAVRRANHFNRMPSLEHHIAVVDSRWKMVEALIYKEQAHIEARERGTDNETMYRKALALALAELETSREQFSFYHGAHKAKNTPDADEKAAVNQQHVQRIVRVTTAIEQMVGTVSDD